MQMEIVQEFAFEAAHFLPAVPRGHRCRRVHGHSYRIVLHVAGEVDAQTGWIMDFAELEGLFQPLLAQLDHHLLNEVPGLDNPTAENIALWIWQRLEPALVGLSCIEVWETPTSRAILRR